MTKIYTDCTCSKCKALFNATRKQWLHANENGGVLLCRACRPGLWGRLMRLLFMRRVHFNNLPPTVGINVLRAVCKLDRKEALRLLDSGGIDGAFYIQGRWHIPSRTIRQLWHDDLRLGPTVEVMP